MNPKTGKRTPAVSTSAWTESGVWFDRPARRMIEADEATVARVKVESSRV